VIFFLRVDKSAGWRINLVAVTTIDVPQTPANPAHEVFAALVAEQQERWTRIAPRIVRNTADAEDVVQDTLAAVWRRCCDGTIENVPAYVARAVRINAIKRRARRRQLAPLETAQSATVQKVDASPAVDAAELERAVAGLPLAQQGVLRARFYMGMTFAQIGVALSVSSNTVASRCRYALATLKKVLARTQKGD
jgi:RNA polymerase sigma-70 factor (ECF subfamily)